MKKACCKALAFALAGLLASCGNAPPRYSGTVQTESVAVGSELGGRIVTVRVETGSRVRRGQTLASLDDAALRAELEQARAQAAQARATLAALQRGNVATDVTRAREAAGAAQAQYRQTLDASSPQIRSQAAVMRDARAAAVLARTNYERTRSLERTGDVSRATLDNARAQNQQAWARFQQAQAQYQTLVDAQVPGQQQAAAHNAAAAQAAYETVRNGPRPEDVAQAAATVRAAEATVDRARTRLREMTITAPIDGIVASFDLHPGDLLTANAPAAIIDTFADPYVYIYASQRDLASFANGTTVHVQSDAGGGTFDGRVETHDRTAQFTPQNTQTADERADLVYGIKIRIHDPNRALLDGTTVTIGRP